MGFSSISLNQRTNLTLSSGTELCKEQGKEAADPVITDTDIIDPNQDDNDENYFIIKLTDATCKQEGIKYDSIQFTDIAL